MRSGRILLLLGTLYAAQGLPYGFFTQALPALLRQEGRSLQVIGLSSLLLLPWGLKVFVAPWVDRWQGSPLGARRGWILPLQVATVACVGALALLGRFESSMGAMAVAMLITAALAATQDCATDGLAVRLLTDGSRGLGNGVQVAAYRVGMIVGGGLLLWVYDRAGWFPTFGTMAVLLLVLTAPIVAYREAPARPSHVASSWLGTVGQPGWLTLLALYKLGDAIGSPMVKPLLVDAGMTLTDIAWWSGTLGSGLALLGAGVGGLAAGTLGRAPTLVGGGIVHAAAMAAYALPAAGIGGPDLLGLLLLAEHFTGSIATVALFTVMMDRSDVRLGATDYTAQATVIVWITALGSAASGFLAAWLGWAAFYAACGAVCVVGAIALARAVRG